MRTGASLPVLVAILAWACGGEEPEPGMGAPAAFEPEDSVLRAVREVAAEPVQSRTGPGETPFYVTARTRGSGSHLHQRIGRRTFDLGLRGEDARLTDYPCSSCHEGPMSTPEARDEDVHEDIQPVHPQETGARCTTCHSTEDVARLRLEAGGTASLDHPYRLCGQCHFQQVRDWAAGAHGKRVGGWRGRRVVMNCTDCHDPHDPAAPIRQPFPGPSLPGGTSARDDGDGGEGDGGGHD